VIDKDHCLLLKEGASPMQPLRRFLEAAAERDILRDVDKKLLC
jgi:hypothetical protein